MLSSASSCLLAHGLGPGQAGLKEAWRIPFRMIRRQGAPPLFTWLDLGEENFSDPFFEETAGRCRAKPENSLPLPMSTTDELCKTAEAMADADTPLPSAFIFHISRCGSTLLSQLLSLDPRHIVLSEVPLLDEILRLPADRQDDLMRSGRLFRAVLRLLGRRRRGSETALFVKLDSWHILFFDRLRAWYPQVPAFLLYRSPREVWRSHQKQRGMHAVPGLIEPELFGFTPSQLVGLTLDGYLELVLARYFQEYLRILECDDHAWPLSYHDGPEQMVRHVVHRCGLSITQETFAAMKERARFHAKDRNTLFAETPGPLVETAADPLFRQLDLLKTQLRVRPPGRRAG